jgi:hypothetical protein
VVDQGTTKRGPTPERERVIKNKFQKTLVYNPQEQIKIKRNGNQSLFKVEYIKDKSLAEFNCKLKHNLLSNNILISK